SICFFFQAEDGIRDFHVTGVQTCALPISRNEISSGIIAFSYSSLFEVIMLSCVAAALSTKAKGTLYCLAIVLTSCLSDSSNSIRSEERRVGNECGSQ